MEIDGETSPRMGAEQEIECLNSALARYDMMRSVLVIVEELVESGGGQASVTNTGEEEEER